MTYDTSKQGFSGTQNPFLESNLESEHSDRRTTSCELVYGVILVVFEQPRYFMACCISKSRLLWAQNPFLTLNFGSEHSDQRATSKKKINQKIFFSNYCASQGALIQNLTSKIDSTPLKTHILIYNMLETSELTQRTNFQLVARRSECFDSRFDLKCELYASENRYYDI